MILPLHDVTIKKKKKIAEILQLTAEITQVISQFTAETNSEYLTLIGHLFKMKINWNLK